MRYSGTMPRGNSSLYCMLEVVRSTGNIVSFSLYVTQNKYGEKSYLDLSGEHDGDDEPVDGDGLAEDDRDEVLGLDPGRLHAAPDDADPGGVDAEGGPH